MQLNVKCLRMVAIAVLLSAQGGCAQAEPISQLGRHLKPSVLTCGEDTLTVFGWRRSTEDSGHVSSADKQAAFIQVDRDGAVVRRSSLADGFVVDASKSRDGREFAVVIQLDAVYVQSGRLFVSDDAWETWTEVTSAPPKIVGARFHDRMRGWAWTEETVFRTEDGGESWAYTEPPGFIGRARGEVALSADGALWFLFPSESLSGSPGVTRLVRYPLDGRGPAIAEFSDIESPRLGVDIGAGVYVAGNGRGGVQLVVVRVAWSDERGLIREAVEMPKVKGSPSLVWGDGEHIVVQHFIEGRPAMEQFLTTDSGGKRWRPLEVPRDRIQQACVTDGGTLWYLDDFRRLFRFAPFRGEGG